VLPELELTIHGAGQTVTGSMFQIQTKTTSFLIDCGLFQGNPVEQAQRNRTFTFDPSTIDYVILTHAHLDHCGRLPLLVRAGFRGPIFANRATADLCGLMLRDVAESEEEDATRARSRQRTTKSDHVFDPEPLFTVNDAEQTIQQFRLVKYNSKKTLPGNVTLRLRDAGHILGSSIVETWVEERGKVVHIVDTGDVGRKNAPIIRDSDYPSSASYLLCESTYANRTHEPLSKTIERFEQVIIKANRHQSHILVPAFAIGRTQALIYALNYLVENSRVPIIPMAIDSPLAIRATEIFKRHKECFDKETWNLIKSGDLTVIDLWSISDRLGLSSERYNLEEANILFEVIRDITKELDAKRLVIDSITSLCYRLQTSEMIRDFIFKLGSSLTIMRCTTFLTSEVPPRTFQYSQYEIEEFIADGIIFLGDIERKGDLIRTLQIVKMRGTAHNRSKYALNMSKQNGIELTPMLKSNI